MNLAWIWFFSLGLGIAVLAEEPLPFSVPEGFSVQCVAGDALVHDCFCMTLDGLGRPVVSGPGYIRTLVDDNRDGIYDRSVLWSSPKQGAQGLWSEGRKLYYVSDGGLWLSQDNDGDLSADPNPKKVLELPTGEEHHAHAIRRGPDGYWYLIAGNFAKDISNLQNDPLSPVSRSRSGTLWRMSPDFSKRGVWAHGMRNCYDFDFMPDGQIVTFESDCEREVTLPWYRPTRVMVLGPGTDAGWCGQSWKDEEHRITMPLVLAQLGRGSPTGVTVYQHRVFPKKYHDAVFVLDWTFGRVIAVYPSRNIEEDKRIPNKLPAEVFMQPTGTTGFAPTDICVGTDGSLLVSVGGRGTTGAIYRILADAPSPQPEPKDWFADSVNKRHLTAEQSRSLAKILTANKPCESWSEAQWFPEVERVGAKALLDILSGKIAISAKPEIIADAKLRCAQVLTRLNTAVTFSQMQAALGSPSRSTRAAAWWLAGRGNVPITGADHQRLEALSAMDFASAPLNTDDQDQTNWELHVGRADERLRWEAYGVRQLTFRSATSLRVDDSEAGNALRRTWLWALARSTVPLAKKTEANQLDYLIAKQLYNTTKTTIDTPLLDALARWVPKQQPQWKSRDILEFLTVLQTALGERRLSLPQQQEPPKADVLDGYQGLSASQLPSNVRAAWSGWAMFLAKQAAQSNRQLIHSESMRTLAMLEPEDQDSLVYCLNQINKESHPTSDIHALCCSANCQFPRTKAMTTKTAIALAGIVRKVKDRGLDTDNQWPIRLQQLVAALLRRDSNLGTAFVELPVACNAEDLTLVAAFPTDVQGAAKMKMRQYLLAAPSAEWSVPVLRFAAQAGVDAELANAIREVAAVESLRSTAADLLSANPSEKDYEIFLSELESKDRNRWPSAWRGLSGLSIQDAQREWQALASVVSVSINTTGLIPRAPTLARARLVAGKLKLSSPPAGDLWREWETHYKNTLAPEGFANIAQPHASTDWRSLLAASTQVSPDAKRGQMIYREKCALCHGGQSSLGPSLAGVAKRFSRDDLSIAIFEPSRTIPDRYRSLRILTTDGEVFTGMVVYSAADGTTLQTATGSIVRVNKDNIETQGYSTESLMPTGLLNEKTPADLADLFAFLATQ